MIEIRRYRPDDRAEWNKFVAVSKNGIFLFQRDYMDYHADRFHDHSLIATLNGRWIAVLPANECDGALHSHQGLTFGGVVSSVGMGVGLMLPFFDRLIAYMRAQGLTAFFYKAVPHIYHSCPAEEDLYALFRNGAHLWRVDNSAALIQERHYPCSPGKRSGINKARRGGLIVKESEDMASFFALAADCLRERHGTAPVHTGAEMELLRRHFPERIKLFGAFREEHMLAGAIVYLYDHVVHTQYVASSPEGRAARAVDLILAEMIGRFPAKRYVDFGHSNEQNGLFLNEGLAKQKEEFGACSIVHQCFRIDLGQAQ
jgi:hypothetical protein